MPCHGGRFFCTQQHVEDKINVALSLSFFCSLVLLCLTQARERLSDELEGYIHRSGCLYLWAEEQKKSSAKTSEERGEEDENDG
jgi:hypothetical protein